MDNRSKTGILLILIGVFLTLRIMGMLTFTVGKYWPVFLILMGIALMMRLRLIATIFFLLFIIFSGLFVMQDIGYDGDKRNVDGMIDVGVNKVDLNVEFGAGDLDIKSGSNGIVYNITTSDNFGPEIDWSVADDKGQLSMKRQGRSTFWKSVKDDWNIELDPSAVYTFDLDYGATDAKIDMRGLKVASVGMEIGATSTELIFEKYPTRFDLSTGASSIEMKFPQGYDVKVKVEGGAMSTDLKGFTKRDGAYYSTGFVGDDFIDVNIEAGATSVDGGFY